MKYESTRGSQLKKTGAQAIIQGIAEDKGLYVPETVPALPFNIEEMKGKSYKETAMKVIGAFFDDFTDEEMQKLGLYYIGEIPRVYTEHSATQKTITSLVEYLQRLFDPKIGSMDGLSTSNIAVDINQRFPRD